METRTDTETIQENKSNIPSCCTDCVRWEKFGKNCFYHWESKKNCSMRTSDYDEAMQQQ
jgi:hypothetical protein